MERILSIEQVREYVGKLGESTLYRMISQKLFPKPIPLHGNRVGWRESDVQDWIGRKIEAAKHAEASRPGHVHPLTEQAPDAQRKAPEERRRKPRAAAKGVESHAIRTSDHAAPDSEAV